MSPALQSAILSAMIHTQPRRRNRRRRSAARQALRLFRALADGREISVIRRAPGILLLIAGSSVTARVYRRNGKRAVSIA